MKRSAIQEKLNAAMQRSASADSNDMSLTREIKYHDARASELRKERQKHRSKKDRADASILRLTKLLLATP